MHNNLTDINLSDIKDKYLFLTKEGAKYISREEIEKLINSPTISITLNNHTETFSKEEIEEFLLDLKKTNDSLISKINTITLENQTAIDDKNSIIQEKVSEITKLKTNALDYNNNILLVDPIVSRDKVSINWLVNTIKDLKINSTKMENQLNSSIRNLTQSIEEKEKSFSNDLAQLKATHFNYLSEEKNLNTQLQESNTKQTVEFQIERDNLLREISSLQSTISKKDCVISKITTDYNNNSLVKTRESLGELSTKYKQSQVDTANFLSSNTTTTLLPLVESLLSLLHISIRLFHSTLILFSYNKSCFSDSKSATLFSTNLDKALADPYQKPIECYNVISTNLSLFQPTLFNFSRPYSLLYFQFYDYFEELFLQLQSISLQLNLPLSDNDEDTIDEF